MPNLTLSDEDVHDLSNHLAVILGFVEVMLLDVPEHSPLRNDLLDIRAAATHAARLIGHEPNEPRLA